MSRPDWCPEDVWEKVINLTAGTMAEGSALFYERIARAILSAKREGMEEGASLERTDFVVWLRAWVKERFGVWITHNTAKGAFAAYSAIRQKAEEIGK